MIDNLYDCYKMVQKNHICFIYNGPIWADGVEGIGQTLRKRLEFEELPVVTAHSVFSIFVEEMFNILYYAGDKELLLDGARGKQFQVDSGVFMLGIRDKQYYIQCSNKIKNSQVEAMKKRIDYLNTLDKQELRKIYREKIRAENDDPDSQGAGIGLIEIARRASSKIEYRFTPLDSGDTFFTLFVTVD